MKMKLFIQHIQNEIEKIKKIILERGKDNELNQEEMDSLFELDANPFSDWNDRENYEFDLGKYYTLTGLLSYVEKNKREEQLLNKSK